MKTRLPNKIETEEQAKLFLLELVYNNEQWHPEDDVFDVVWMTCSPTSDEKVQLNRLIKEVYAAGTFDPCAVIMDAYHLSGVTMHPCVTKKTNDIVKAVEKDGHTLVKYESILNCGAAVAMNIGFIMERMKARSYGVNEIKDDSGRVNYNVYLK